MMTKRLVAYASAGLFMATGFSVLASGVQPAGGSAQQIGASVQHIGGPGVGGQIETSAEVVRPTKIDTTTPGSERNKSESRPAPALREQ